MFPQLFEKLRFFSHQGKCLCCGGKIRKGEQFCPSCLYDLEEARSRQCPRCGKPYRFCHCSPSLLQRERVRTLYKLLPYRYDGSENGTVTMLFRMKNQFAVKTMAFCAEELGRVIRSEMNPEDFVVTYAPRSKHGQRHYGYDQGRMFGEILANTLGIPFVEALKRQRGKEQKYLTLRERRRNVEDAFLPRNISLIENRKFLLFDDLVTTGSTLGEAAKVLYQQGASRVVGVCLFRAAR